MLKKIEDIKKALEAKAYLSALALTLTLPDICGKVAYPEIKKNKDRYIKWYDKYSPDYFPVEFDDYPKFDGKKCYKLRCSYLHEGSINDMPDLDYFELHVNGCNSYSNSTLFHGETYRAIKLDINQFCLFVCNNTKVFYDNCDDKSVFNDHNIALIDITAEVNEYRKKNNLPTIEEETRNLVEEILSKPIPLSIP